MKRSFIIAVALLLGICITTASAREVTRFGPKQYTRSAGPPQTITDTFAAAPGEGRLIIENGAGDQGSRVRSAVVRLNGTEVFGPPDFNPHVAHLEKAVILRDTNTLAVELRGKPGTFFTLRVAQEIPLEITITAPLDGATVTRNEVMVEGIVTSLPGDEVGVVVNGMVALVSGDRFVASHVPLQQGANTITAQATDTAGNTVTASITVNAVIPEDYIRITADTEMGISPLETILRIDGSFSFVQDPSLTYTGPGDAEVIESPTPTEYRVRMTTEGIYYFTAEATGPDNKVYTDTVSIVVLNKEELDALLQGKWDDMKTALITGDIQGALRFHHGMLRDKYEAIYKLLGNDLSTKVQQMQDIELIYAEGDRAKYRIRRDHTIEGQTVTITYYIYFSRDETGLWKIERY